MRLISLLTAACALSLAAYAEKLPPLPKDAFTYVCIPDTQHYREKDSKSLGRHVVRNPSFDSRVDWIAAHVDSERIFFVSHMGDITDSNKRPQWEFASAAMGRLEGKVPFAIAPGNHDQQPNNKAVGDTSMFSEFFPKSRFAKFPWYADCFPGYTNSYGVFVGGNNANSCQLVDVGKYRFVLLHVENNAPRPVLDWVDDVLERYRDRTAIIATHVFLGFINQKDRTDALKANPQPQPRREQLGLVKWCKRHGREATSGEKMWREHFSRHRNVRLIVNGDQGNVITHHEVLTGVDGNRVDAFIQDYPKEKNSDWIRLFRFQPNEGIIEVYTYSPQADSLCDGVPLWPEAKWHRFTIPFGR